MTSTLQGATRSGSNGGTAPTAGRPTTIRRRRSWRPGLLALSLFLIVGSMLAGLWLYQSTTSRVGILVAATDLQAGDQLTVADTRVQYVAAETEFLTSLFTEDQAEATGFYDGALDLTVGRSIPAGSPLVREYLIAEGNLIPAGKAVVGMDMRVGTFPQVLRDGDTVELFFAYDDKDVTASTPLGTAEVWSVTADESAETVLVDLIVDQEQQESVVQAHRTNQLRFTVVRDS